MPRFSAFRAAVVLSIIATGIVGLMVRVAYLQTYFRQKTILRADQQQHTTRSITARRGTIFDANGHALAGTVQQQAIYIDPVFMLREYQTAPRNLNQMDMDLRKLARLIDADADELSQLIGERYEARYVRIAESRDDRTAVEVMKLGIPGVGTEPMCVRYYPMGSLAAHVLGSVGGEGNGLEGIELKFNRDLSGRNGYKRLEKDARRRPIGIDAGDYVPPVHGQHMILTIDASIQFIAEHELAAAVTEFRAESGEVIVIDPRTGEVLALANYPTFHPQHLSESRPEARLNRAIVVPYEPGSTFKPFIAGPAIMWRQTRPAEMWPIPGLSYIAPYGRGRRVTDVHHYGPLATWDVLVKSSNIGMAMMAARMGNPNLHKAVTLFGFGRPTGIELPGEDGGMVNPLRRWTRYSTESVAQGYEVMITPMQLARAFCVYANGGHLVSPRIVKGKLDPDGRLIERYPLTRLDDFPRVMDEDASGAVRQILSDVLVRGTGTKARSKAWNLFGKTGTSHISMGRAGYSQDLVNSSFVAGAPLENPRLVVAMVIHKADRRANRAYGGTVAAPAAGRVLERSLAYMQVPPSPPLQPPPPHIASVLHDFRSKLYGEPPVAAGNR